MDEIKLVRALILLIGEQKPMPLPELASFTYLAFLATELWQSWNYMFRLQLMKLPEVHVADPLMPQVDVRLDLLPFRKHNDAYMVGFEDNNPPFMASLCDYFVFLFYEAP